VQQAVRTLSKGRVTSIPASELRVGQATRRTRPLDFYLVWAVAVLILVEAVAQAAMAAGWLQRGWMPW